MINMCFSISSDEIIAKIELPEEPPSLELIIKATMACQFDSTATNLISEQIRSKYGDDYYNKTVQAMSAVIKSFREIIQNSLALDPEAPAVPVIYMMPRGQK